MMRKFLIALFLLCAPISASAFAHSGTDQEERACAPDVQRFYHPGLPQGKSSKAYFCLPFCAGQSRAITSQSTRQAVASREAAILRSRCQRQNRQHRS